MIPPDIRAENQQFIDEMAAAGTPVCKQGCFVRLPPDGVCRLCEPGQLPRDVNDAGVITDGHGEEYHTYDEVQAARKVVEAYERIEQQVIRDAKTPPNGCRWCGLLEHGHGNRYAAEVGYHLWAAPNDGTRLGRMHARRAVADMRLWGEVNRRWAVRAAT